MVLFFLFVARMGHGMPGLTLVISQNNNTRSKGNKGEMELLGEGGKKLWLVREQGAGGEMVRDCRGWASWREEGARS